MAKESKFEKKKKEMARKMKSNESGKKSPSGTRFEPEMDGGEHDKTEKKYKLPKGHERFEKKEGKDQEDNFKRQNNVSRKV